MRARTWSGAVVDYASLSASERRFMPPAVAVSTVAFALYPPEEAVIGDPEAGETGADRAARGSAEDARPWTERTAETDRATGPGAEKPDAATLWIPLVRRTRQPFQGVWALPGGSIPWDETLSESAERTLRSTVGRDPGYLEQLYAFGGLERSGQAQRLVTIAYWALYGERDLAARPVGEPSAVVAGAPTPAEPARWDDPVTRFVGRSGAWNADPPGPDGTGAVGPGTAGLGSTGPRGTGPTALTDGPRSATLVAEPVSAEPRFENIAWFSADRLPELAFDHADIVEYALWRLRMKTEYAAVAHRFLGPVFTLAQLRQVHEAILGHEVDPANFRRQALAQGHLVDTGQTETGTRHRPAKLYRFRGDPEHAGT